MGKKEEDFYQRLKEELVQSTLWPAEYLYKFIVPTDDTKIAQVQAAFNNMGAVINTKTSSKGKYTSISINVRMKNPEAVIEKYLQVGEVEGVISL
ncbi:DUF493 family protein [Spongiivirga sp. MCCC 1A20706]|uniref:DUF493 family protein n=1 Tax=Spongiivirga sp. MCCC 1A20706 TaxID=3160963 RepID=UPI0039779B27